ncbi:MAG: hypothetical protein ABSG78_21585 [Verrucomicrobiota bacterium]
MRLVGQAPARLTGEQAAWVLGCQPHDVPVLVAARLLRPLGNPTASSVKYFSRLEIMGLAQDRSWLARVTNAVNQHWQTRNAHKKNRSVNGSQNGPSRLLDVPTVSAVG